MVAIESYSNLLNKDVQVGTNCVGNADRVHLGTQNLWGMPDFSGANMFSCKNEKNIESSQFYLNR